MRTHVQPPRLSRVIHAAVQTRVALSRPAWTARRAAFPQSEVWTRMGSTAPSGRLPLLVRDAGFSAAEDPGKTSSRKGSGARLVCQVDTRAQHKLPFHALWAHGGHTAPGQLRPSAVAPVVAPAASCRVSRGRIWKQPPTPDPLGNSSLRQISVVPNAFFFFLVLSDPSARSLQGSVARRSPATARAQEGWGSQGGGSG